MPAPHNSPRTPCSHEQADISALLDGELERERVHDVLGRVLHCPSCQAYYENARQVDALFRLDQSSEAPPVDVWQRIEAEAATPAEIVRPAFWSNAVRRPALLAAVALLVLATSMLVRVGLGRDDSLSSQVLQADEIVLAGDSGMDDERFLELAAELLQADDRYHKEMFSLMNQLESDRYAERTTSESRRTSEGAFPVGDGYDPMEASTGARTVNVQLW